MELIIAAFSIITLIASMAIYREARSSINQVNYMIDDAVEEATAPLQDKIKEGDNYYWELKRKYNLNLGQLNIYKDTQSDLYSRIHHLEKERRKLIEEKEFDKEYYQKRLSGQRELRAENRRLKKELNQERGDGEEQFHNFMHAVSENKKLKKELAELGSEYMEMVHVYEPVFQEPTNLDEIDF